jgi:Fe-S cluster assembly iron-binding protein IscA
LFDQAEERYLINFKGGFPMLEVTQAATTQVAEYFKGQNPSPIRIFLNEGG